MGITTRAAGARQIIGALVATILLAPLAALVPASVHPRAAIDPNLAAQAGEFASVIVRARPGFVADAARAVEAEGGRIEAALQLVDGFAATVPSRSVEDLAESASILGISANLEVVFEEMSYDSGTTASHFAKTSGATDAWAQGRLGQGIGVALIDTGVSSMNDFAGRVVFGPDLSGEGRTIDNYGHGTAMAGVIAGSGADSEGQIGGAFTGIAPKAHVVSVKVAGRNGVADVSTVLQAMHWVAAYKDQYNIRVLNLSWGTRSTQDPAVDPLNYAVERLWGMGIVVVVAAGNSGPAGGTVTKPGDDPVVLTVGAYNDEQNVVPTDDNVPAWSSRGPTSAGLTKPDVVSPGRRLVSSRSFGSFVEVENGGAWIAPSYIRGSGTSQAAALVSGLVALLLEARPGLTPDQVKALLRNTASPIAGVSPNDQGAGRVQLGAALSAAEGPASSQTFAGSGLGSIEASRGGGNVQADCANDGTLDLIVGEIDVRCEAWNGSSWTGSSWTGSSWTGSSWTGSSWTGSSWTGSSWTGSSWTGSSWTGGTWTGSSWTGSSWTGSSWTGSSWTGSSWTGSSWTGSSWTGSSWTGSSWTGSSWTASGFISLWWGLCPMAGLRIAGELALDELEALGLPCV